jgi:protein phosphatase
MVVEHFCEYLASLPGDFPAGIAIREAATRANEKIFAAIQAPYPHVGSTVVVALVQQVADGTFAWIGHIGDSRAYLVRAGRLYRLTTDHTAVQDLLSRGLITPEEAPHHPDASVLTRSLGRQPEVEIDIEQHALAVNDTLLLCSDGLWAFVPEQEIQNIIDNSSFTVKTAAHKLLKQALAVGGDDNVGLEIVRLIQPPDLPVQKKESYVAIKVVLVMLLLAFATVCVLGYLLLFTGN